MRIVLPLLLAGLLLSGCERGSSPTASDPSVAGDAVLSGGLSADPAPPWTVEPVLPILADAGTP